MPHAFANTAALPYRAFALAAFVGLCLASSAIANTITFSAPTITLSQSSSPQIGYFDVLVTENVTTSADTLTGFGVDVTLNSAQSGIQIIGADYSTNLSSPFASYPYTSSQSSNIQTGAPAGLSLPYEAFSQDEISPVAAGPTLSSAPLGLLRIEYQVAANYITTSPDPITILSAATANTGIGQFPAFVELNGSYSPQTPVTSLINGSIAVLVPEPSALSLAAISGIAVFGALALARRRV